MSIIGLSFSVRQADCVRQELMAPVEQKSGDCCENVLAEVDRSA